MQMLLSEGRGMHESVNELTELFNWKVSRGHKVHWQRRILEPERTQGEELLRLKFDFGHISLIFQNEMSQGGMSSILLRIFIMLEKLIKHINGVLHMTQFGVHVRNFLA